ncbi:MAG: acetyl-CoA carboxylase biotin carboxyl carrier protein subunit [Acidobacteria bacterium]|nr:acetyl-CoA carboxylase biotin carboxyl carrier protein subunit [Acidobacteriota bacterium]
MAQCSIAAHVTGVVVEPKVVVGDVIQAGDDLIIFESMKMHVPLASPIAGTVVETLVDIGDLVEEGQAVVIVDADEQ